MLLSQNNLQRSDHSDYLPQYMPGDMLGPTADDIRSELEADAWKRNPHLARQIVFKTRPQKKQKRSLKWQDRLLLGIAIVLMALLLLRIETASAQEWGLEMQTGDQQTTAMALNTDIHIEVTGLAARYNINQRFVNNGSEWAEGIYRFPLPDGAAVDRMRIIVSDRILEGEIQEKQQARRTYAQARDNGQTASLVEQQRPNQFETSLANIGPGEEILVNISFLQKVDFSDGMFSLRMPMTFTSRFATNHDGTHAAPQPVFVSDRPGTDDHRLSLDVDLRSGMNLALVESRYHDVDIHPSVNGYYVYLSDSNQLTDRDFELTWAPDLFASPSSSLMIWDSGEDIYAMMMLAPPMDQAIPDQAREVVFIIDTSGSMDGTSIAQAKDALMLGLEKLGPHDAFNIIQFNSHSETLFERSVVVSPHSLDRAHRYIERLEANGGTVMGPALQAAFNLPLQGAALRQVVFITDGSVGNEADLLKQIGETLGDSRLFTVAIGSAPNTWFMRKSAEVGRGSYTHIGKLDEVAERMDGLWKRIQRPALSSIEVDWGQNAEYYPEIIPDLYAGQPLWVTARLDSPPSQVRLTGIYDGMLWEHQLNPQPGPGTDTVGTLWARSKIEALEDSLLFGMDPTQIRQSILDVALEFGLLSQYTSLVAVDKTPVRLPDEALNSQNIPNLLPAGSNSTGFSSTATDWKTRLLLSLLTLLVTTALLWFSGKPTRKGLAPMAPPSAQTA